MKIEFTYSVYVNGESKADRKTIELYETRIVEAKKKLKQIQKEYNCKCVLVRQYTCYPPKTHYLINNVWQDGSTFSNMVLTGRL